MSIIFVANGTLQHHRFIYRLGRLTQEVIVEIKAGAEVQLPGGDAEFDEGQLADVLKQLHRRGAVPSEDLRAMTRPRTLIYKVSKRPDQPISANVIDAARERDELVRQEDAGDKVEQLGVALLGVMEETIRQAKASGEAGASPEKLKETTLTIRQLEDAPDQHEQKDGADAQYTISKKQRGRGERARR